MSSSPTSPGSAQRFFSQGKRIPKDVKRHCGMCRQHDIFIETRGHTCEYKDCPCERCNMVRKRRAIMSTQIRLRREQDKKFQRTTDVAEADIVPWTGEIGEDKQIPENINMCYFCQKCKNHGVLMWKKDHKKKCQFTDCRCEMCDLIDSRRALDRHMKKRKLSGMKSESIGSKSPRKDESSSEESSSSDSSSLCGHNSLTVPPTVFKTSTPASLSPFEVSSPTLAQTLSPININNNNPQLSPLNFSLFPQFVPTQPVFPIVNPYLLLPNPFFMDMQILLQNLSTLNATMANTD